MFTVFNTALSGLSAVAEAINVVGDNLANLNTTGFKASTVSFHDMMDEQLGVSQSASSSVGMGVGPAQAVRSFTQGGLQQTTGPFDAAIQGQGFFVVRGADGQQLYTRAGNFTLDSTGHLLTASGEAVQGWTATGGVLNVNGAAGDIVIPISGVNAARPTANLSASINLDAGGVVGDPKATPPVAATTYAAPMQIIDSLGESHTLTASFTKTGDNAWSYSITVPAADLKTGGTPEVLTGSLAFDSTGKLSGSTAPVDIKLTGLANGAADQTISWSLAGNLTQFAQPSGLASINQDGKLAGQITSVGMADGGLIVARYSSGEQQTVGQLALASIANPDTLLSVGGNNLQATADTSAAAIGTAGTGGRGSVVAGSLEGSTVDIATEFTNLITFQRSYSADSKVITTGDEMLQELLTIKR